ncbi:major capsid protein [Microvirus mar18]|uniref:Major capsid protein n=1 Tax=Microvirus mar18 TaxID=2851150 RepID=A0A8F5MIS8_9VIRU|nr:major capsid protein [Microvirus mar18]
MSRQYVQNAAAAVTYRRSRFDLSHGLKTSMNVGTLYPLDVTEVLPGDTFKMHTTQVCRVTSAFLRVPMDNLYMDVYYFFVPNRLVYDDWENVMGNSSPNAWTDNELAEVPTLSNAVYIESGSVADYMGLPLGSIPKGINMLPFRGFALIYDEWFRNENTVPPMLIQKGAFNYSSEYINNEEWSPSNYVGKLPKVSKRKDYFTGALPAPQKGAPVDLPLGQLSGVLPVIPQPDVDNSAQMSLQNSLKFKDLSGTYSARRYLPLYTGDFASQGLRLYGDASSELTGLGIVHEFAPLNLAADLASGTLIPGNINDLRLAFQLQKMLEKDARYGTRYREYLLGHFGVSNPDARMQIPEFLGGSRMPIRLQQVAQTNTQQKDAEQAIESPLASLGAMSHSVGQSRFTKSFTEHGFVFTVACIRQFHTYQQGINKMWFRSKREHYYDPLFANLGEQPIYSAEIRVDSDVLNDLRAKTFGFREAWADYRAKPSLITGEMRSGIENSLDVWNFADYYNTTPTLSQEFTDETPQFVDRTLAVPSTSQDQFIVDFAFDLLAYRVMPVYSTPGLIDHH